jgi:predicted DNA-binding transcriptional regulator YafY
MLETSARLLRLLGLLQTRRDWTSAELATRLNVTTRTIRNDMARLRALGYPVEARPGVAGGYRLGTGGSLPPLLLDDEEAVAVAIGLRTAANGSVAGIEEASVRALAKLQQMLPSRLRQRVGAIASSALPVPSRGPEVDPDALTLIASACRDHERLRFDYRTHSGTASRRSVEPYRLVNDRRRWYLVAWDADRDDWRTFRVDRIEPRPPAGPRFTPRALPPDREIAAEVARGAGEATWQYRARVMVHAPAEYVRNRLPISVEVDSLGEDTCAFEPGSDHPEMLALYLGMLGADFTIVEAPELVAALRTLTGRYHRAIEASQQPARRPRVLRCRQGQAERDGVAVPERPAGAGAADVTAARGHAVRQRAGQHAEQFLVPGRTADHEDLRRVLAERAHRPPEVRRQHGLLEPQPDGAPFAGSVMPVERQPAARAFHGEHPGRRGGRGDVQEAAAAVLALEPLPAVHPDARPALDPVGGGTRDAEHLRHRGG